MTPSFSLSAIAGALLLGSGVSLAQTAAAPIAAPLNGQAAAQFCDVGKSTANCPAVGARVFSAPSQANGSGHRAQIVHDLNTFGPSVNFGNSGGWTVTHVIEAPHVIFGTSGIDQYEGANVLKNGTGDLAGLYFYVYGGGRSAQSDEGVTGMTVESGEISGYFHGTISGGAGSGATSLTLQADKTAQHNHGYTCAGCMLLDISKGKIAGNLNGKSQTFGSTYLYELPTTGVTVAGVPGRLPLTQAWCTTTAAIPPTAQAGVGTSRTVSCTLGAIGGSTPAFKAGGVVTIAGSSYPEQATLTAVDRPSGGVQSLTLLARNPNPAGSVIFQGGIAGQSLSFDANLAASGFRSSYYVFGSTDGTNLIYGSQIAGSVVHHPLPRAGAEAEQTNSGFHLYPSAEVVANTASPSAPVLEPNAVDWQAGDAVENPRFQSFGGTGIRNGCAEYTPPDQDGSAACMMLQMIGPGISGSYHPFRLINQNPLSIYRQGGGVLDPVTALNVEGFFGDILAMHNGPSKGVNGPGSVINILNTAAGDGTPFNLFLLPSVRGAGAARVTYDPQSLTVGFPNGISVGALTTAANCTATNRSSNCGNAASGSIAIVAGNSITIGTSAVTDKSQILITADTSLDARLGVTCNKAPAVAFAPFGITARVPGHSFTLTTTAATNGGGATCFSYTIIN